MEPKTSNDQTTLSMSTMDTDRLDTFGQLRTWYKKVGILSDDASELQFVTIYRFWFLSTSST